MQTILQKMLFSLIFIFLVSNSLLAQIDTVWTKTFGEEGINKGICLEETHDGGNIVLSEYFQIGSSTRTTILTKTNYDGLILWQKSFTSIIARSLVETSDSGFVIFGGLINENQAMLIKTNQKGDTVWTKTYSNSIGDGEVSGYNVIESDDGGYILLGTSGEMFLENQIWIAKTDTIGNVELAQNIFLNMQPMDPILLLQKNELGYLVIASDIGFSEIHFVQLSQDFSYTYSEFKTRDPQGFNISATSSVSPSNDNRADSIAVIAGERGGNFMVARIDMGGNQIWSYDNRFVPGANFGQSIVRTDDEGYFVVGTGWNNQDPNLVLLKINHNGVEEWSSIYTDAEGIDVSITSDNGFIVLGTKDKKIWLLKLKAAPIVEIATDSLWLDDNWDGFASGTLDGTNSSSPNGFEITSYEWKMEGNIIGTNANLELNLPTGDNIVELKVTDENGIASSTEKIIKVCSFKYETEGAITSSISTTNDSIFYASSTDDRVYCFNNENQIKWNLATGGDIMSTTTIGPLNNIYVGSSDTRLYCFDSLGNFKWDTPMGGVVLASPAITNDLTIYVGTENNRLYSVNGSDGTINWNYLTSGSITSSASLSNSGDIYFGSNDKNFYSLGKTGTLNWSFATNGSIHSSPAIDTLGRIYFGSTDGKLYSLNPDGSLNWSFQSNGSILSSPAIDFNGNIYFGSGDSSLYSIDVNGNELWKYKTSSSVNGNPSLTSGGNVIFGCDDGTIYSLSETGELNWSYKTDLSVESSPLVTSTGRIYVGSNDKSIYGFLDSESLQLNYNHQWPTFQKDNKRTGSQLANTTSIDLSDKFDVVKEYKLNQNYPNPFNPSTAIDYSVATKGNVSIIIYDALGREIATLVNEEKSVGNYKVNFNAELLTSGIYFYQMKANDFFQTKKMILLR